MKERESLHEVATYRQSIGIDFVGSKHIKDTKDDEKFAGDTPPGKDGEGGLGDSGQDGTTYGNNPANLAKC